MLRAHAPSLTTDELLDVIEDAQRDMDAAAARQAIALAHLSALEPAFQEDGTWVDVHHGLGHQRLDAPELAAPRMGVSTLVAANRMRDAIRQEGSLPDLVDAMAAGDLDQRRASVVVEETDFLDTDQARAVVACVRPRWRGLTQGPLRRLVARTVAELFPDEVAAEAERARERRFLVKTRGEHGIDTWHADLPVERSALAWAAVTEAARRLVRDPDTNYDNLAQARADALTDLILEHSDIRVVVHTTRPAPDAAPRDRAPDAAAGATGGGEPGDRRDCQGQGPAPHDLAHHNQRPDVALDDHPAGDHGQMVDDHADRDREADARAEAARTPPPAPPENSAHTQPGQGDVTTGAGDESRAGDEAGRWCEVGGLGGSGTTFVPASLITGATGAAGDLTCHPITGALMGGDVPAGLATGRDITGTSAGVVGTYRIPAAMARFVRLRDGSCRFPGCTIPARQCDLDHVRPWPNGPTSPTNLVALCRHHHRIKQRHGWRSTLRDDGTLTWRDPSGHTSITYAVDHLHLARHGDPARAHLATSETIRSGSRADITAADLLGPRRKLIDISLLEEHLTDRYGTALTHHHNHAGTVIEWDEIRTSPYARPQLDIDHTPFPAGLVIDLPPREPAPDLPPF